ncbi:MAG: prolipoprotein diacylglyceryl transferase [Burkholderiales bacterium]|nr:prolipoprotein diacylglyceryl transferase [Burkholderiales bacterium]
MIQDPALAAFAHACFEYAGIAIGVALYRQLRAAQGGPGLTQPGQFAIVVGLLLGAGLGNKAVFLIERPDILQRLLAGEVLWPGQSIVGGLLGGLLGVELAKLLTRQHHSTGDVMVLPLALGMVIGRIGCFLAGLNDDTYGLPTTLPWGWDFGDGVRRHPTQLYDIVFVIGTAWILHAQSERLSAVPGLAFKLFLAGYLAWRLGVDGLKPVRVPYPLGLSGIQWVCAVALVAYAPWVARAWRRLPRWPAPTREPT